MHNSVVAQRPSSALKMYVDLARPSHWIKNLFVIPGFLVALSIDRQQLHHLSPLTCAAGFLAVCLITSSNYVLNEILDAGGDRNHPYKSARPLASGKGSKGIAYFEWLLLMALALLLGATVSKAFNLTLGGLWLAGCLYNVPPFRTKDIPYLDVLSEAINNPLRMLCGWYLTKTGALPIASLLISYWMAGCYFMAIKRFAEYRELGPEQLLSYRRVFRHYSEKNLLTAILFYGSQAMLFFGAFIARYRLELLLTFPLVALVMALYFLLAFRLNSPVQHPEGLYREPLIVLPVLACAVLMTILLFVDVPLLHRVFAPSVPRF